MIPSLPTLLLLCAGATAAAGWWGYSTGREHERNACQAAAARDIEVGRIAADSAASAAASAIRDIKVQHRTITQEIQREVIDRPVYRSADCSHRPEQLQRINAALTGASGPQPADGGRVPRADPAQ